MLIVYDNNSNDIVGVFNSDTRHSKKEVFPQFGDEYGEIELPYKESVLNNYNDYRINGNEVELKSDTVIQSSSEMRKNAYYCLVFKNDEIPLIDWFGTTLTVEQANKIYLDYFAESNPKAEQIQPLIIEAKAYIRNLYPDEA